MEEVDDSDEWRARALTNPALPAYVLFCLRDASRRVPCHKTADLLPAPWPEEAEPSPEEREVPEGWGSRGRRSRMITVRGIRDCKEEEEAAQMRASPITPLDFRGRSGATESGASGVGGEEGSSVDRSSPGEPAGCETQVGGGEPAPMVFRIPSTQPIKRQVRKKTIPELQAVEKSLVLQRVTLRKEVEVQTRVREALMAENQRLKRMKLSLESQRAASTSFVQLPDLNISLFEELG